MGWRVRTHAGGGNAQVSALIGYAESPAELAEALSDSQQELTVVAKECGLGGEGKTKLSKAFTKHKNNSVGSGGDGVAGAGNDCRDIVHPSLG